MCGLNKLGEDEARLCPWTLFAGDETRRVVAHTLSHAHVEEIERATGPVQLPVGTRVGLEQAVHTAYTVFELDRSW